MFGSQPHNLINIIKVFRVFSLQEAGNLAKIEMFISEAYWVFIHEDSKSPLCSTELVSRQYWLMKSLSAASKSLSITPIHLTRIYWKTISIGNDALVQ